jgi:hypothetical protein
MLPARLRVLIVLVVAWGLSAAAQEPALDPAAIVLLAEREGHTADAELERTLLEPRGSTAPGCPPASASNSRSR